MKLLGHVDVFGRKFRVTEHRKVKADDGDLCDGLANSDAGTICLRKGREPHTDLHELIHVCAQAVGFDISERNVDLLARAMWQAGAKVKYHA